MGRTLEFAMTTAIIYLANIIVAFFIANKIGMEITSLFNVIIEALILI